MSNVLDPTTLKVLALELAAAMPPLPEPNRFLDDIVREANACLLSAEEALLAYMADDEASVRLLRVERATALVQATLTVLRSMKSEGVSHG